MFTPKVTTERYDKNIFDGKGQLSSLYAPYPISMRFYFAVDTVVAELHGHFLALVHYNFQRGEWLPIEVVHLGKSYCGWVSENEIILQ